MFAILRVSAGPDKGRTFTVNDGQTLLIGHGDDSHTKLRDGQVEGIHCKVVCNDGVATLIHEASEAETLVNDEAITQRQLSAGDHVQVGMTTLAFQLSHSDEGATRQTKALRLPESLE